MCFELVVVFVPKQLHRTPQGLIKPVDGIDVCCFKKASSLSVVLLNLNQSEIDFVCSFNSTDDRMGKVEIDVILPLGKLFLE